jgi:hypothetical protein
MFRALRTSLLNTAPCFPVEELHGSKSHVVFPACPPWTKPIARCELADFCIVWFRRTPQPCARIAFLQAKRSTSSHWPCIISSRTFKEHFRGDSTQWYLMHKRPKLHGRFSTFQPPSDLLKDAILPSVTSYCIFHGGGSGKYSFFYASADVIRAARPASSPGDVRMTASRRVLKTATAGRAEQKFACCPVTFGEALFDGRIGTPIDQISVLSERDGAWRSSVRTWLLSILATAVQEERIGPVVRSFLGMFEATAGPGRSTALPARSMVFIRGDLD